MATTIERIRSIFEDADIRFDTEAGSGLLRTIWVRDGEQVTLLVVVLEDGGLVQLRAPLLVRMENDEHSSLVFRAMLQMAYEMRLVQFEYDPTDGEVSTCIDIALEDAELTAAQLLRCCTVLLDVSFHARERLTLIMETGEDPELIPEPADSKVTSEDMVELAKLMGGRGGGEA